MEVKLTRQQPLICTSVGSSCGSPNPSSCSSVCCAGVEKFGSGSRIQMLEMCASVEWMHQRRSRGLWTMPWVSTSSCSAHVPPVGTGLCVPHNCPVRMNGTWLLPLRYRWTTLWMRLSCSIVALQKKPWTFRPSMDSEHVGRIRPWSRIPKNPDSLVACAQW